MSERQIWIVIAQGRTVHAADTEEEAAQWLDSHAGRLQAQAQFLGVQYEAYVDGPYERKMIGTEAVGAQHG